MATEETERLIDEMKPVGSAELRRSLARPLAVAVVTRALSFEDPDAGAVLGRYDRIMAMVRGHERTRFRALDNAYVK